MKRKALTDGTGRWFDLAKCEQFDEDTRWDGHNHISVPTGSQWEHETLYRTSSGRWIRHRTSQWDGSADSWAEITPSHAAAWLVENQYEPHDSVAAEYAALELP